MLWPPMKKLIARARYKREADLKAAKEAGGAKQGTKESMESNILVDGTSANIGTNVLEGTQSIPYIGTEGYQSGYKGQWQQQQQYPTTTPIPWLLEDSTMQDLGLDMNAFDPNMQWEGVDDLMQDFHSSLAQGPDVTTTSVGDWDSLW